MCLTPNINWGQQVKPRPLGYWGREDVTPTLNERHCLLACSPGTSAETPPLAAECQPPSRLSGFRRFLSRSRSRERAALSERKRIPPPPAPLHPPPPLFLRPLEEERGRRPPMACVGDKRGGGVEARRSWPGMCTCSFFPALWGPAYEEGGGVSRLHERWLELGWPGEHLLAGEGTLGTGCTSIWKSPQHWEQNNTCSEENTPRLPVIQRSSWLFCSSSGRSSTGALQPTSDWLGALTRNGPPAENPGGKIQGEG